MTAQLNSQLVFRIERGNVVLGAAVTAVAGIVWGLPGILSAGVGAVLGAVNFWALHRLSAGLIRRALSGEGAGQAGLLVLLLMLKIGVLFGCVWIAVFQLDLAAVPFTLGISAFVISVLVISTLGVGVAPSPSLAAGEASKTHG